ncbi:MAG: class I SAM-dependent methyltransferase [Clostridiales bacterium]|nr:class I SAM-dependent methyltransferase [Clostridiales bacterium]
MEHYFTKTPISDYNESIIEETISNIKLHFYTGSGVFSKNGIDYGSCLLINAILSDFDGMGTLLDMGCGYGPIGIFVAAGFKDSHVEMADINERAIELSIKNINSNKIKNAEAVISDGFSGISRMYDAVVTNPPIRAGKKTVFSFYEGAFEHLREKGKFYCVIQRKQGAESSKKKLEELFGNCEIINRKSGYHILQSTK